MHLVTVTEPTVYPVDLCDVKENIGITDDLDDIRLIGLIRDATDMAEMHTGMRLASQTVKLVLDSFPTGKISLGTSPVSEITSFSYDDTSGNEQTLTLTTDYYQVLTSQHPYVYPNDSWPETLDGGIGNVRITMTVGYADPSLVPGSIKRAIIVKVKELFDIGGETVTGLSMTNGINTFQHLLAYYRRFPE